MAVNGSVVTINSIPWNIYERGLDKITKTTYDKQFNWIPQLYLKTGLKTKKIEERSIAGIPNAEPWNPNGDPIPVTGLNSRFKVEAVNGWIGNSVAYTLENKTFDASGNRIMSLAADDLGLSIARKKNASAIGFLAAGFDDNWNAEAAEVLFTDAHKLDPRYGNGAETASNLVTGGATHQTLAEAINLLVGTPDDLGNPNDGTYIPKFLLCHTNQYMNWKMVVGDNKGKSDTANNTPNPFLEYGIKVVPCALLPEENLAFLFSNKTGLVWNEVIGMNTAMDSDGKTFITSHAAYSCFTRYIRDWRGIIGITAS